LQPTELAPTSTRAAVIANHLLIVVFLLVPRELIVAAHLFAVSIIYNVRATRLSGMSFPKNLAADDPGSLVPRF
jgi:hypothetical protein